MVRNTLPSQSSNQHSFLLATRVEMRMAIRCLDNRNSFLFVSAIVRHNLHTPLNARKSTIPSRIMINKRISGINQDGESSSSLTVSDLFLLLAF
ncbi:hypothetical protein HanIR_Chr16g0826091 [Helianthus annuus]|nr:hypothetical protein HanIR_Chr16g0826091 [Helianthus annuus]